VTPTLRPPFPPKNFWGGVEFLKFDPPIPQNPQVKFLLNFPIGGRVPPPIIRENYISRKKFFVRTVTIFVFLRNLPQLRFQPKLARSSELICRARVPVVGARCRGDLQNFDPTPYWGLRLDSAHAKCWWICMPNLTFLSLTVPEIWRGSQNFKIWSRDSFLIPWDPILHFFR